MLSIGIGEDWVLFFQLVYKGNWWLKITILIEGGYLMTVWKLAFE
jgi:hypothetical protein